MSDVPHGAPPHPGAAAGSEQPQRDPGEPAGSDPSTHPGRSRRGRTHPPPHPWSGAHAYALIGGVCLIGLNLVSHFRGGPTLLAAFAAGPTTREGLQILLHWGVGPFLLWPLWLPLSLLHGLQDIFT